MAPFPLRPSHVVRSLLARAAIPLGLAAGIRLEIERIHEAFEERLAAL